jgi:hypothetical protein
MLARMTGWGWLAGARWHQKTAAAVAAAAVPLAASFAAAAAGGVGGGAAARTASASCHLVPRAHLRHEQQHRCSADMSPKVEAANATPHARNPA